MKKFYIILILIVLFFPPVIWTGLFIADKDLYVSLDYDLGEKREKTQIEELNSLALSGEAITDWFADRAPFRSSLISFKKNVDSVLEGPYEYDIKPAALMRIYGIEDTRTKMAVDTIANAGQKYLYKSDKIRNLLTDTEKDVVQTPPDCNIVGHDWRISNMVDPTYISYGYTEYICKNCGEEKTDDWTDKLIDDSYLAPNVHGETTIGRFNWLFLHGWGNLPYYQATNILSEEDMNVYVDKINTLQAICDARGIEFAVILTPSKDTIYPEYMPSFEVMDPYKRVPRLFDYIKEHSSVKITFPCKELKDITRYYESYYKYDSHWNFVGSFIGVQSLYGLLDLPQTDILSLDVTKESREASGDLIELGKLNASDFPPFYEYVVHYKDDVTTTYETQESVLISNIYKTETDCADERSFVMIGDSYRNFMIPYIKKDFNHCTFAYRDNETEIKDDILNADILVLQSSERYDYRFLKDMEYLIRLFSWHPSKE